jgi:hypothetical protein
MVTRVYRDRHIYRVLVLGRIGRLATEAFADLSVEPMGCDTALVGELDQAGLFGTLLRIQQLRLELVEVTRVPSPPR